MHPLKVNEKLKSSRSGDLFLKVCFDNHAVTSSHCHFYMLMVSVSISIAKFSTERLNMVEKLIYH